MYIASYSSNGQEATIFNKCWDCSIKILTQICRFYLLSDKQDKEKYRFTQNLTNQLTDKELDIVSHIQSRGVQIDHDSLLIFGDLVCSVVAIYKATAKKDQISKVP